MALVVNDLADQINIAIAATDKNGAPIATTPYMKSWAKAIIDTFKAGIVSNLPGTITGTAPPGGPLSNGTGTNGLTVLMPSIWISDMTSGFPGNSGPFVASEATASTTYAMASGKVSFASGNITGTCTASASPGILAAGAGTNGKIGSLVGNSWGSAVKSAAFPNGNIVLTQRVYTAVVTYLEANADVSYLTGTVTGSFGAGGGTMTAGAATGGMIA